MQPLHLFIFLLYGCLNKLTKHMLTAVLATNPAV
jgi:hypothetical protein